MANLHGVDSWLRVQNTSRVSVLSLIHCAAQAWSNVTARMLESCTLFWALLGLLGLWAIGTKRAKRA